MKILSKNRKAYNDYEIIDKYEAGIELLGSEVKSARRGSFTLKDSYCRIKNGEIFLYNSYIAPYKPATYNNHDPERVRKLLLHKREILKLHSKVKERGLTIIPLKVYLNKKGLIKIEIALAKGKREYEKKQRIKERTIKKEIDRYLKNRF